MRPFLLLLVILLTATGCEARRGGPSSGKPPAASAAPPCPECSGLGRCPRCGESRPCLACDGDGRCPYCVEGDETADSDCVSCAGSGRCATCENGPASARIAGQCLLCPHATGLCPECGGEGTLASGRSCLLCRGLGACPECGGDGLEPFCAGSGTCASCRGHGTAESRPGDPPILLLLGDGRTLEGTVIGRPGLSIEIEIDGERHFVPAGEVSASSRLRALRASCDDGDPDDLGNLARLGIQSGGEVLFFARALVRAASAAEAETLAPARRDLDLKAEAVLAREAADGRDPARRRLLWLALAKTFPDSPEAAEYRSRAGSAGESVRKADQALPEPLRLRKNAAQAERAGRVLGRAVSSRERAEALLGIREVSGPVFLRAREAARAAAILASSASAGSPDADPAPFDAEHVRAREREAEAVLRLARFLEATGRTERALALGRRAESIGDLVRTEDR